MYRGRFAPSPTGPLHFGSLIAAVGSYVMARRAGGEWWVRIDDVDRTRCVTGAADDILRTLERFALYWDGPVVYQSQRDALYEAALKRLIDAGLAYPCGCTRKEVAAVARRGPAGLIYPGTCEAGLPRGREARAWRVRTAGHRLHLEDRLQPPLNCDLHDDVGDFIVRRGDGLFAYHLACVVDDAEAGVTEIVRGADLLWSTPPQIHLQRALDVPTPAYAHLPVAVNESGNKLSKQTFAAPLNPRHARQLLIDALRFLGQKPPDELARAQPGEILAWAVEEWRDSDVPRAAAAAPAGD